MNHNMLKIQRSLSARLGRGFALNRASVSEVCKYSINISNNNNNFSSSTVRCMSSNSKVDSNEVDEDSLINKIKKNAALSVSVAGGTVVLYGISKLLLDMTLFMGSLTPAVSLYYGFVGGVTSAGVGAVLVNLGYNATRVQPERVYRQALSRISSDAAVSNRLGGDLKVVDSKAYNSILGGWSLKGMAWRQPTVVLSFILKGRRTESVVSVLASRSMFQWDDTLLRLQITYLDDKSTVTVVDTLATSEADHAEGNNDHKSQEVAEAIREHHADLTVLSDYIVKKQK